jgi:hypothetical protein
MLINDEWLFAIDVRAELVDLVELTIRFEERETREAEYFEELREADYLSEAETETSFA